MTAPFPPLSAKLSFAAPAKFLCFALAQWKKHLKSGMRCLDMDNIDRRFLIQRVVALGALYQLQRIH